MSTVIFNTGIGICFAAILVIFILSLSKDSTILKKKKKDSDTVLKKDMVKDKAKHFGNEAANFVKNHKGEAKELAKTPIIYYRPAHETAYRKVVVKKVPFVIGTGPQANLILDDPSVAEKQAVLDLVKEDDGYYYCFKNTSRSINTDYLDQDSGSLFWVNVDKGEELILEKPREAFYLGNTKVFIEAAKLERKVSPSDNMVISLDEGMEKTKRATTIKAEKINEDKKIYKKRTPSDRMFEDTVLDVSDISC